MLRIPEEEYPEDNKASPQIEKLHPKDAPGKSRYHMPLSPDICSDPIKNSCFPKAGFLNNAMPYAAHVIKSSSPASSTGESVFAPEFANQMQMAQNQQMHAMAPGGDINFYSFPDFISDQEKNILSDTEKLLRSKENDMYSNEYNHIHDVFAVRKYYHPLFAHGICRWPGCEMDLEDIASFVKHLNSEHGLDDRSTAQARVQMQVVSQLESHLQKERDRLQAMMHHLYLSKQLLSPTKTDRKDVTAADINFCGGTAPIVINNVARNLYRSHSPNSVNLPMVNSTNISTMKKRNHEKSTFSVTGGLPYMLERAGLDVQHEIQRNREFYKNADVRPPFTYASLIRQAIIDSPDKQLTLNEIYNWFQNTFCYFRRNAATWKNAIRTNLSLHKCFVRYEDDFGSFWMVDDNEFIKRRHLSRGRPRKYETSSSPNSNQSEGIIPIDKHSCDNCSQNCPNMIGEPDNRIELNDVNETSEQNMFNFNCGSRTKKEKKHDEESSLYASDCLNKNSKSMKSSETLVSVSNDFINIDDTSSTIFQRNVNNLYH
ncbi:uncharacterized protein LOC133835663 isoform X1 [Drosophila sulfurigaster albostrigata]|uniref:uncharacterized protein LOC133835663 isoform X1 n=1 Tax=Drosophila sulfurigaster albostrigata TaxID=89887 RepID=UPI002D21EAF9|nr:uncharacterized protein LOC133835663 isoform X1 [Drosophila sulfurigaster albostrigata]XP_062121674.1 uncharacterized protein LOC133835663 isoform X1 [Drosophila sulfurigaster albostrigata]